MIKMLTAYTSELNDAGKAVRDILGQLDLDNGLLKNSVALVFCHAKFIETGVTEAVCKSLPFAALGCTSQYFAVPQKGMSGSADGPVVAGEIMLTLTVLTSDDTEFAAGVSEPLNEENLETAVESAYRNIAASFKGEVSPGEEPFLILDFQPTMYALISHSIIKAVNRVCGGIPVFGAVALDFDTHLRRPKTIYRGAAYDDRIALLLFKGPVKPRFFSSSIPGEYIIQQDAVITGVDGNRILSINNEPATSFIKDLGILQDGEKEPNPAIPLIIEDRDAGPMAVVIHGIGSKGEVICTRSLQVGDVLSIGILNRDYVIESANSLLRDIKSNGSGESFLVFSCILRSILLGENHKEEIALFQKELEDFPVPYLFISSAGEICPRYTEGGTTLNKIYVYALIACQF